MRMLLNVRIPHEPFNAFVRDGTIGDVMERILAAARAYATEGEIRGAMREVYGDYVESAEF